MNAPPTATVVLTAEVEKYLPAALTVLLKVVVWPAPNIRMPLTAEPFTVRGPALPKVSPPFTALISPHAAPAVAAKMIGALIVTSPVLWFSIFACTPPLSKSESTVGPPWFRVHALLPVHSNWFIAVMLSLMFVVRVLPLKVIVP